MRSRPEAFELHARRRGGSVFLEAVEATRRRLLRSRTASNKGINSTARRRSREPAAVRSSCCPTRSLQCALGPAECSDFCIRAPASNSPSCKGQTSSAARQVWLYDAASGRHERLTDDIHESRDAVWSASGDIYYLQRSLGFAQCTGACRLPTASPYKSPISTAIPFARFQSLKPTIWPSPGAAAFIGCGAARANRNEST